MCMGRHADRHCVHMIQIDSNFNCTPDAHVLAGAGGRGSGGREHAPALHSLAVLHLCSLHTVCQQLPGPCLICQLLQVSGRIDPEHACLGLLLPLLLLVLLLMRVMLDLLMLMLPLPLPSMMILMLMLWSTRCITTHASSTHGGSSSIAAARRFQGCRNIDCNKF